ncbi:hypothetical protein ACWLZS_001046 [Vibrio parahaemolyticus]|uniref:hypothetical protein n=1 Tax=Vibrio parahaemolyticus TaxID=670 RepID=UPI00046E9355|nr:hypothetical protein [Vibrio parahaemolyticus]HCE3509560.1 hypothetical protein [Vibrio parahaemolyticus]
MKILYLGKAGKLNAELSEALRNKKYSVRRESARINIVGIKSDIVVFGGRYFNGVIPDDVRFLYLSTLSPNPFRDKYQELKHIDDNNVKGKGGKVISIPFIDEMVPPSVVNILTTKSSRFYIYKTSISDIIETIVDDKDLFVEKCYVDLTSIDKFFWMLFSNLYKFAGKIKLMKLPLLVSVKVLEKVLMSLFGHAKLSSVYIGRED